MDSIFGKFESIFTMNDYRRSKLVVSTVLANLLDIAVPILDGRGNP
jgi:hypothetical protein